MTIYNARIEVHKADFFNTLVHTAHYLIEAETPEAARQEAEGWRRCYDHGGKGERAVLASVREADEKECALLAQSRPRGR